ncbi:MAG TPA: KpsF/GutQ family sugar-phosphate isomerase [Zeimonas sp.]|nr:KpsF/GutQ family sugar-phosphate isomerase [Zeimonas sp.]
MSESAVDAGATGACSIESDRLLERAREVLRIEADAVRALAERVDERFADACRLILACRGRVVVSGMGKSGHVARKIAATLASTGTPSFFMHPGEASHGDLGMITSDDVLVALSNSGSTDELLTIVPVVKRQGARLVAITGNDASPLARAADVHLSARVDREACPLNLAPTASTTAALALGDALAVALLDARGFGAEDFARSHPGGLLGRRLLTRVSDVMRSGDALPIVRYDARVVDAIIEITRKRMGMTAVLGDDERLVGIFTDGDLRRLLETGGDLRALRIDAVMTREPATIDALALAAEAVHTMEARRITQLLVVDADARLVGALNVHDLLAAKVV